MDWRFSSRIIFFVVLLLGLPRNAAAQASIVSPACAASNSSCVTLDGSVVFEAGRSPPAEVSVVLRYTSDGAASSHLLRAVGPAYRFEARLPRGVSPEITLVDLPPPWLNDRALQLSPLDAARTVQLTSDVGVRVTATFRFPPGALLVSPLTAVVRRSEGDRWFAPVEVMDGWFSFFARREVHYAIAASPLGFGNVLAEFPGQSTDHAVHVDVERHVAPTPQSVVLSEGGVLPATVRRVLVPLVLGETASSGGGELPYRVAVVAGSLGARDLVPLGPPVAGRRQRVALLPLQVRDDSFINGERIASLRLEASAPGAVAVPDIEVTVVDDETTNSQMPRMTLDFAELVHEGGQTSTVLSRREGGAGEGWEMVLRLRGVAPAGGAAVTVHAVAMPDLTYPGPFERSAAVPGSVEGVDFQAFTRRIVFAAGTSEARFRIEGIGNARPQPERRFALAFTDVHGLIPADPAIELRILDDDLDDRSGARADRFAVSPGGPPALLNVLANDVLRPERFSTGRIELLQGPVWGSAVVETFGTANPLDDRIRYTPLFGGAGQVDRLTYRLCEADGEVCAAARIEVLLQAKADTPTAFAPNAEGGHRDIVVSGLPALPDARVEVLARVVAKNDSVNESNNLRRTAGPLQPARAGRFDPTWNAEFTLPPLVNNQPVERTVLVHAQGEIASDIDLYVGYDANRDGIIASDEILCSSATTGATETCLVTIRQTASSPRLRIGTVNFGAQWVNVRTLMAVLADVAPIDGVVATAPTRLAAGEAFPVRVSWSERSRLLGEGVIGLLRIRNADGSALTDLPFVLDLPRTTLVPGPSPAAVPTILRSGLPTEINVPRRNSRLSRAFIDVPPGTGRLVVRVAALPVRPDLSILRPIVRATLVHAAFSASGDSVAILDAPSMPPTASGQISSEAAELSVTSPAAGRWYIVLDDETPPDSNFGEPPLDVVPMLGTTTLTATLSTATAAPIVRPGGYFNPARSGHGLFLYPAAGDWAGLWYTYSQDGAPVWYYLQAAAPGANGIWSAPIYRSGWNGSRNHLTEVGRATITPTAADAFQFTYVLDGETGSEPFSSFGRGCPSIDGRVVNASGHWFDPARAGAGYSVQLLPNYEFHAVFGYSARGVPRFLVAERSGVGAANDTLALQQLRGFCPLCVRSGDPERSSVGVLRREFVDGQLARISVDAAFANGTPGTWVVNDAVIPLGGLQGCAVQ